MSFETPTKNVNITAMATALPVSAQEGEFCAPQDQTASDLTFAAASSVIDTHSVNLEEIGAIIYIGASPDYRSPATACVLQGRLGLSQDCLAYDMNISGCGFTYALQIGTALLRVQNKSRVMLMLGDTPSKWTKPDSSNLEYVDAGTCILLSRQEGDSAIRSKVILDSSNLNSITLKEGGFRNNSENKESDNLHRFASRYGYLDFNQSEFEKSAKAKLPGLVNQFIAELNNESFNIDISLWPALTKDSLKNVLDKVNLANKKLYSEREALGSNIPLALAQYFNENKVEGSKTILASEYGEGLTGGLTTFSISGNEVLPLLYTDEVFDNGAVDHEM